MFISHADGAISNGIELKKQPDTCERARGREGGRRGAGDRWSGRLCGWRQTKGRDRNRDIRDGKGVCQQAVTVGCDDHNMFIKTCC